MEAGLNLKLKKALSEMLFLSILEEQPRPILEVSRLLGQRSGGVCSMQFPYAIVYRMMENGYIVEQGSRKTQDRRRTFYALTDSGKDYLRGLEKDYKNFINAVNRVFSKEL